MSRHQPHVLKRVMEKIGILVGDLQPNTRGPGGTRAFELSLMPNFIRLWAWNAGVFEIKTTDAGDGLREIVTQIVKKLGGRVEHRCICGQPHLWFRDRDLSKLPFYVFKEIEEEVRNLAATMNQEWLGAGREFPWYHLQINSIGPRAELYISRVDGRYNQNKNAYGSFRINSSKPFWFEALEDVLRQTHQHYRERAQRCGCECECMCSYAPRKTSRPDFGPDQVRCLCQLVPGMQYSGMHRGMHKNIGPRIFTLIREPFYKTTGVRGWRIEVEYQRSYGNFRETIYLEDHNMFPYNDGSWNVNHWIAFTDQSRHLAHLHCHHHCCGHRHDHYCC